ncbi:hypothetical protein F5Y15DRAFT_410832 [Xylariaceae sp. FL0016]|nr:hypothetical protein F5Y15DRAFT_410832 [Xylariaceae sp. FL0016]
MAQKTSDSDDHPTPSSPSTKESPAFGTTQKQSTSHNSSPAPASKHHHQKSSSSNSKESGENASDPQLMTKTTMASANSSSKDALMGPSPYGTRSRNRGQARPNYAEDKDVDVEMDDAYPEKKEEEPKKPSRQSHGATNGINAEDLNLRAATTTTRKSAPSDDAKAVNDAHAVVKDPQPIPTANTDVLSATAPTVPSKKRKAAAQSTANHARTNTNTPTPSVLGNAAGTRRSAAQADVQSKSGYRETNMLSFENCGAMPKDGKLVADDGTILGPNDHVYLVCEPPGEPYYLGRIMEFLHVQNDAKKPIDALRVNWYYRPKDIGKKVNDTRLVFATMHSDINPLTALRGKCQIRHKAEIDELEAYRRTPDCFWYEKLYDRYIQKHYDVVPCFQIINVPERVKKVLDERWKFILVEQGRAKEFTSAVKLCKRCGGYCASNDSVDCAHCNQTFHMNCVRPPLLKKPSRGFAWACAACSRAQERKLEARHTPSLQGSHPEAEEEELWDEDEEGIDTNRTSPADGIDDSHQPATAEQIYHASLWPYRYLGQHCKPEDALDYDDRIYPRAGSRLGPKHQAIVLPWPGKPVQLEKPFEVKKSGKREGKPSKETLAAIEKERLRREKRPKWIQDEPPGYVARGEDLDNDDPENTAQLLWKPADAAGAPIEDKEIDAYIEDARTKYESSNGLPKHSTNFLDVATNNLSRSNYNPDKALKALAKVDRSAFDEPELSSTELKKFEEAVAKFGSELKDVTRHVKTVKHKRIVRFYYTWKKSARGKQVWGNFSGRKGKKEARKAEANANKLQDDVADDRDDSAFDTDKALERKRNFMCKFCSTKSSRQWRRAPSIASVVSESGGKNANKDKSVQYIVALCRRCAELWRRYAIQWEDLDDVAKKVAATGRGWKRKIDEEVLKELKASEERMSNTVFKPVIAMDTPTPAPMTAATAQPIPTEAPPRKKLKTIADKEAEQSGSDAGGAVLQQKKKEKTVEKPVPPPPPPPPELPPLRTLPCAICSQMNPTGPQTHLCCKECRLTVHRACYGVVDNRHPGKWTCDMCLNDKNPQVSIEYKCVLCPVDHTEHDFAEPPKNTHKKKTEKDREKERHEKELAQKAVDLHRKRQEELNRPASPREPLKRTADNNWVHVTCAVWTPEVKFASAKALGPSEGIPSIPRTRYEEVCKACKQKGGACVNCHQCRAPVHIGCAQQHGYLLGFEITPVKGSRRDQHQIVTIGGETGAMSAAVWCKEHIPTRTVVHRMHDVVGVSDGQVNDPNALQLFVRNFKQADLALTGTVRKANLANLATKTPLAAITQTPNRRQSTTTTQTSSTGGARASSADHSDTASVIPHSGDKVCITCGIDVSPRWWPINKTQEKVLTNGYLGNLGDEAQKFIAQRNFQCHKCRKDGRQPVAHAPLPPVADVPRTIEPLRPPPISTPTASSPPPQVPVAANRLSDLGSPWTSRPPAVQTPAPPPPPAPAPATPTTAPALHAQPSAPPPALPLNAPHGGPSPMAAPGPPPIPVHHYPPPSASYGEWQRGSTQPPPSVHHMNGASGGLAHHNHLRDLRPPPIAPLSHHQGAPIQHGLGQPMVNGIPPSPPGRGPTTMRNATPSYAPAYHHSTPHPLHSLTNGGPPPRPSEHSFSQGLLSQRSPFSTPHGSPPVSRDSIAMSRESSLNNNPPSRNNDGRPPSGASASPSLRNLLS